MNEKGKVGIVTFHRAVNYGAILQAVALQKYTASLGYDSEIIDYKSGVFDHYKLSNKKTSISYVKDRYSREKAKRFERFLQINAKLSNQSYDAFSIHNINTACYQYVITGSDQVWNPDIVRGDSAYLLDFVPEKGKKLSYAASIGVGEIGEAEKKWLKDGLGSFKSVSVREKDAKKLLVKEGMAEAAVVCDPTLLLETSDWVKMEKPIHTPKRYVLVYSFGTNIDLWNQARKYASEDGTEVCFINDSFVSSTTVNDIKGVGPAEWLYVIHHADCVYTNSYHGMLFSVIYGVPFWVADPGDGTFSRFEDIMELLNCKERVIRTVGGEWEQSYDRLVVTDSFEKFVNHSKEYLIDVLDGKDYSDNALHIGGNTVKEKINVKHVVADDYCTGCTACVHTCHVNCIQMLPGAKGSRFPHVDASKCVQCGKCLEVCTKKAHTYKDSEEYTQKYYALKNADFNDRMKSSSGGAFILLMELVISRGGVVYGVKSVRGRVSYGRAEDFEKAKEFCKSKYVECHKGEVYRSVKKDLESGREVLFSGTPCTVAGLRNFLGEECLQRLYTVDIICHGTPVPVIYRKYVRMLEKKYGAELINLDFRDKIYDKSLFTYTQKIRAEFANGKVYHGYMDRDPYYKLFWSNAVLRDSCFGCKYATIERCGDITIGDWWGDRTIAPEFFADNAESSVLVNTKKGEELLEKIRFRAEILEVDAAAIMQRNLREPTPKGDIYNRFWRDYYTHSFTYCLVRYADLHGVFRVYGKIKSKIGKLKRK